MNIEQLDEAKKIHDEIESLKKLILPLKVDDKSGKEGLAFVKRYFSKNDGWQTERTYAPAEQQTIPIFLQDSLKMHLETMRKVIIHLVEEQIEHLEKKFKAL
jgi:hypothetical protein